MKSYILITGASSGLGLAMARQLAAKKQNLILLARREEILIKVQGELSKQYDVDIEYVTVDLSEANAAKEVFQYVEENQFHVTGLINNAGFGDYGNFIDMPLKQDEAMIGVNITALVGLTKLFAAKMVRDGNGKIMNVASILSYLPFPYYSVYSATKSFVAAFTETIAAELEGSGVIVTSLIPGTIETDFHTPAMRKTNAMSANKPMPVGVVAKAGVDLFLNGEGKKAVGFINKVLIRLPGITPDRIMRRIKKNLASPTS